MAEPPDWCLAGRYRMEGLLGAGGMGEVWAAWDLVGERAVAVKVLGGAFAGDRRAAERLRREARAAGRLEHPNIARVLDHGDDGGRPFPVMELLQGETLAERVGRAGAMAPDEAARVVASVAGALEAAHRAGIVHRDVKPANVFLTAAGGVKVLDFGIAWCAHEASLTTGGLLGTAAYLAPERVLGHRATPAADVYALGVVLYELLAGRRPFEADSEIELAMAHVNARPVPLALVAPAAPAHLVAACERTMAKDPSARPSSAAAFADLLRAPGAAAATRSLPACGAQAGPGPAPARGGASGRRPRRRFRRGLVAALLLAVAVLGAGPALGGGLLSWVADRAPVRFVVPVPGGPEHGDPGDSGGPGRSGGGGSGGGGNSGPG